MSGGGAGSGPSAVRAEIVAVGSEILAGQTVNRNAATISGRLAAIGVEVVLHTAVADDPRAVAEALEAALGRADVVVVSGGLGPTHDDVTRAAIAQATGRPLERRHDLVEALRDRYARLGRRMAATNLRQAEVPAGATALPNPLGSAPGIGLEHAGRLLFALPGVPAELEAMLDAQVVPVLARLAGGTAIVSRVLRTAGVAESEVAERLEPVIAAAGHGVTVALLTSVGEVRVRITGRGPGADEARRRIDPVESAARAALGAAVFGAGDQGLEAAVADALRRRRLTLAVAESVTGGLVCSRLVSVPGASEFLRAGFVVYSLEAKVRDLAAPRDLLDAHGGVSAEVARAMAQGARERAGSDLGLSTTGEAGPEPAEAEVGTCFVGLAWEGGTGARGFRFAGGRETVRRWAAQSALNELRLWTLGRGLGGG